MVDENNIHDNFGASAIALSFSNTTIQQNIIINPEMTYGISVYATQYTGVPQPPASILNNIIADHMTSQCIHKRGTFSRSDFRFSPTTPWLIPTMGCMSTCMNRDWSVFTAGSSAAPVSAASTRWWARLPIRSVSYTLFHDNAANGDVGDHALYGDPLFVDPLINDYHIQAASAAINIVPDGGIYEDIDDDDRPSGWGATPFDAGADEFVWTYGLFLPLARK